MFFVFVMLCMLRQDLAAGTRISDRLGISSTSKQSSSSWQGRLRQGLSFFPGGKTFCDFVGLKSNLEGKVDRIVNRQTESMTEIQKIAQRTKKAKCQIEEMYYFKRRSQEHAAMLSNMLKRSKSRNFLGIVLEEYLGIPVNPADYIPDIPQTAELRKNLGVDLYLERNVLRHSNFLLHNSRAALSEENLASKSLEQFDKEYAQAVKYEDQVLKGIAAKERVTLKFYKEEIARLEKEIRHLEKTKGEKGLTVSDVVLIEQTIEMKRGVVRDLNEKINKGIKDNLHPDKEQQMALIKAKADKHENMLIEWERKGHQAHREKYGHLWKFF